MRVFNFELSIILLIIGQLSFAQPGFNIVKDLGLPTNHIRAMLVDNDTIVGYGLAYDTANLQQGLLLAKFDSSGNFISSNLILDSSGDFLGIDKHWGEIISTSDGGYAMTAAPFISNSAYLIKVNHHLEVEFIKEYPDTVNLSNYAYKLIEIPDGYLLYGSIQRPNASDDPFVRRVDKQGNTVWFNYYGEYNLQDGFNGVDKINDTLFVFVGGRRLNQTQGVSFIQLIDWHGDIIESWISEIDPEIGYLRTPIITTDGGWLLYGQYVVDIIGSTFLVQPTLSKMNDEFEVQWVKHYGRIASINAQVTFWDIKATLDGNYIGAGESGIEIPDEPGMSSGWLMKFSSNGDSIWSRYDLAPFPPHYTNDHFFGGVGVLSSGNIVAAGAASEGNKYHIWLVKVTPDGCLDTLFCGLVGVGDVVEPVQTPLAVLAYPNPTTEYLTLEIPPPLPAAATWTLHAATGQPVRRAVLAAGQTKLSIPLEGLPPGLYFWKAASQGRSVGEGKVVIGR